MIVNILINKGFELMSTDYTGSNITECPSTYMIKAGGYGTSNTVAGYKPIDKNFK